MPNTRIHVQYAFLHKKLRICVCLSTLACILNREKFILFIFLNQGFEKLAVIIDIGCAYTKCGLAGESIPRQIIPSSAEVDGHLESIHSVQK